MGNEGSLPEDHIRDEEFEQQARAPPSHSNPEITTTNMKAGGRMINAVLNRRDKNKQNNATTETPTPYPSAQYPTNGDGLFSEDPQQQYYGQQESYQMQQQSMYPQHGGPQQIQQQQQEQIQHVPSTSPTSDATAGVDGNIHQSPSRLKKGGMKIINSMKNLSIGNAIRGGASKSSKGTDVNEWETKWDEDDDDDDESDEEEESEKAPSTPLHPQVQPGTLNSADPTVKVPDHAETPQQKTHLVTATPENDVNPPQSTSTDWNITQRQASMDKPNVQMFLPLLRVLGKGSFGKVSESHF